VSGGYIIVDDYGYFSSGAKTAVDEFIADHSNTFDMTIPPKWAGCFAILTKK
jgi:O-methyltransferase